MPSLTGPLDDNALELVAALIGNLADLPFNAYFIDGIDIGLPSLIVSHPSAFRVLGSPWRPIGGTGWPQVTGASHRAVPGTAWPQIRGRNWTPRGGA